MNEKKILIIYIDGTTETREIVKRSIPETTLLAAMETGKQVVNAFYITD